MATRKQHLDGMGLTISEDTTFERWQGWEHGQRENGTKWSKWELADWVLFGEQNYKEHPDYKKALGAIQDYTPERLHRMANVAKNIPLEYRCRDVSFEHHSEVATLPRDGQQKVLRLVSKNPHTTVADIRKASRRYRSDHSAGGTLPTWEIDKEATYSGWLELTTAMGYGAQVAEDGTA